MPKQSSSEKHARYFEAIIQLRPADPKLVDYVVNFIEKSNQAKITNVEELKTGINLFITSKRVAMAVGKRLKAVFPGELTLSRTLHTRDRLTSKDVYRVTVLFRLKHEDL
jgi:NMD protein affecting ribosome stability and mRNA decay